jgi:hypothetical protein
MMTTQPINMDVEKVNIEKARVALEAKRLRLEHSFPRKWGPLMIGFLLPITTGIIGIAVTHWEKTRQEAISSRAGAERDALSRREKVQQDADKEMQNARLEKEREIASARTTLELYFKHIDLMDSTKPAAFENLSMLAEISGMKSVRDTLVRMAEKLVDAQRSISRSKGEDPKTPSELLRGVPDLVKPSKGLNTPLYDLSKFTAYMQAPAAGRNGEKSTETLGSVRGVLKGLGLRTPDTEFVKAVPDQNEIRIYLPEHRMLAEDMAKKLLLETGETFSVKQLSKTGLPDGVLEIWMKN